MPDAKDRWTNEDEDITVKVDPAPPPGPDQHGWLLVHEKDLGAVDAVTGLVKVLRSDMLRVTINGELPEKPAPRSPRV